ncbi:hypothetical protein CCP3SC15_710005 [Gammaproteobacteria bacterium]
MVTFTNWNTCNYHGTDITLDWTLANMAGRDMMPYCWAIKQAIDERMFSLGWQDDYGGWDRFYPTYVDNNTISGNNFCKFFLWVKRCLWNFTVTIPGGYNVGMHAYFVDRDAAIPNGSPISYYDYNSYADESTFRLLTKNKIKTKLGISTLISDGTNMMPSAAWCYEVYQILNLMTKITTKTFDYHNIFEITTANSYTKFAYNANPDELLNTWNAASWRSNDNHDNYANKTSVSMERRRCDFIFTNNYSANNFSQRNILRNCIPSASVWVTGIGNYRGYANGLTEITCPNIIEIEDTWTITEFNNLDNPPDNNWHQITLQYPTLDYACEGGYVFRP